MMLACPVRRGGSAGSALLGGLQLTSGHLRPEDINLKARRRFTPAAPLPLSHSPAPSCRVFEELLLSPVVIQSLNFGKLAKAPSHCRCCLSSVRDVWISFLAVTEMTLFPLIKGYRCQESDVNFPAQLLRGHEAQERATKQNQKTKKKRRSCVSFCDRVFDNLLNKMSRLYIFLGGQ